MGTSVGKIESTYGHIMVLEQADQITKNQEEQRLKRNGVRLDIQKYWMMIMYHQQVDACTVRYRMCYHTPPQRPLALAFRVIQHMNHAVD